MIVGRHRGKAPQWAAVLPAARSRGLVSVSGILGALVWILRALLYLK